MSDLRTPSEMRRQARLEAMEVRSPEEERELRRLRALAFYRSTALGDR